MAARITTSRISILVVALLALSRSSLAEAWPYGDVHVERGYENTCARMPIPFSQDDQTCHAPKNWYAWKSDDYAPWTQRPMCVTAPSQDISTPEQDVTYCLFTKSDFGGHRGITFFTTPRIADTVAGAEALRFPSAIEGVNNLISGPFSPPPYKAHLFPDRGIGLVANRTLYRGERIMQETPTWIYDRGIFAALSEEDRIPMQWHGVYMLPREARDEFMGLHGHHGGDRIDDLMRTNAFGAYFTSEDMHNNVLPRISRFNHDCRPNAHYYFDPNTMTQYVHALKEIAPGEEILINYTDGENTFEDRQAATMVSWGFACKCSICRQPADHVMASDKRLRLIKTIKATLNDWTVDKPERPEMAELLIELYQQERLWAPIATAYEAAAYAHAVVGDEYKTRMYAGRAVEALTILYGSEHELTADLEQLMLDPSKHRTWRYSVLANEELGSDDELEEVVPLTTMN